MKIRPCSKCNSKNVALDQRNEQIWPMCLNCHILGEPRKTAEEAIAAWNWRYDDWISVKKRLPEENKNVLCYFKKIQSCLIGWFFDGKWIGKPHNYFKYIDGYELTHWKPLPEPPEVNNDI